MKTELGLQDSSLYPGMFDGPGVFVDACPLIIIKTFSQAFVFSKLDWLLLKNVTVELSHGGLCTS